MVVMVVLERPQGVQSTCLWLNDPRRAIADRLTRALEMEVTMVGLQNAGKTSLLRVLAVSVRCIRPCILYD